MTNAPRIKELNLSRDVIKGQITTFSKFLSTFKTDQSPNAFKLTGRLDRFKNSFTDFDAIQSEIERLPTTQNDVDRAMTERFAIQEAHFTVLAEAEEIMAILSPPSPPAPNAGAEDGAPRVIPRRRVKLPETSLPVFSGRYEDWLPFHDSFKSLIHDQDDLSNIEKLHYLKGAVTGEAANKIKHISITDENYKRAWDLLQKGYADKRLIIAKHLSLLLKLPVQTQESAEGLRRLADETQQHVESLAALNIDISPEILVQNLEEKLHKNTLEKWEEKMLPNVFPKLDDMLDFLATTAARLSKRDDDSNESSENAANTSKRHDESQAKKSKASGKKQAFISNTSKTRKCPVCSNTQHPVWKCKKFLALGFAKRIETAKNAALCLTCLRNHEGKDCKFQKCFACDNLQNILLHEHQSGADKN